MRARTAAAGMSLRRSLKPTQKSLYFRYARKRNAETNGRFVFFDNCHSFIVWEIMILVNKVYHTSAKQVLKYN